MNGLKIQVFVIDANRKLIVVKLKQKRIILKLF